MSENTNVWEVFQKANGFGGVIPFDAQFWSFNGLTKKFGYSIGRDEEGKAVYDTVSKAKFLLLYEFHSMTNDGRGRTLTSDPFLNWKDPVRLNFKSGPKVMSYQKANDEGYIKLGRLHTYYVGYVIEVDGKQIKEPTVAVLSVTGTNMFEASTATTGKEVPLYMSVQNGGREKRSQNGTGATLDYTVRSLKEAEMAPFEDYIADTVGPLGKHVKQLQQQAKEMAPYLAEDLGNSDKQSVLKQDVKEEKATEEQKESSDSENEFPWM